MLDDSKEYTLNSGELSIAFLNDQKMTMIHSTFMNDSSPTDVITFAANREDANCIGEICISVEYALGAASLHDTSFSYEITLYLIHGCLHLMGYNDICNGDYKAIKHAESNIMGLIECNHIMPRFRMA